MTLREFRELTKDMPEEANLWVYSLPTDHGYQTLREVELKPERSNFGGEIYLHSLILRLEREP